MPCILGLMAGTKGLTTSPPVESLCEVAVSLRTQGSTIVSRSRWIVSQCRSTRSRGGAMGEGVIPSRIKGETARAYRGFTYYCEMGAGRSLRGMLAEWVRNEHETGTIPPTRRFATLNSWSSRWGWQDRVAEYERRAAEQREQHRQQQRIEVQDGVVRDGLRMLNWWDGRWQQYEQTAKGVTAYNAREMAKLRREVDDLVRRSLGLPDRATESTIKGTGDDGAILVQYVDDWRPPTEDPE
jgi:hypothetical protein